MQGARLERLRLHAALLGESVGEQFVGFIGPALQGGQPSRQAVDRAHHVRSGGDHRDLPAVVTQQRA